jgi:hypothetical protein
MPALELMVLIIDEKEAANESGEKPPLCPSCK